MWLISALLRLNMIVTSSSSSEVAQCRERHTAQRHSLKLSHGEVLHILAWNPCGWVGCSKLGVDTQSVGGAPSMGCALQIRDACAGQLNDCRSLRYMGFVMVEANGRNKPKTFIHPSGLESVETIGRFYSFELCQVLMMCNLFSHNGHSSHLRRIDKESIFNSLHKIFGICTNLNRYKL